MNCNSCHKKMWFWQGRFKVKDLGKIVSEHYHKDCFANEFPEVYDKIRSTEY